MELNLSLGFLNRCSWGFESTFAGPHTNKTFSTGMSGFIPVALTPKQLSLYAGIGLAASGIVTIFLVYQSWSVSDFSSTDQSPVVSQPDFRLEEVHASTALVMHIHARLELLSAGQALQLPGEIGIASELWHDHALDQFGPSGGLLAPMHTHDSSGIIHIESVVNRNYTLGEFIAIWGIDQGRIVSVTNSDGLELDDYLGHVLRNNEVLIIELRV